MSTSILNSLTDPQQIRDLNNTDLKRLADELRAFIIDEVQKSGGHFSGNLGVIELTVALFHHLNLEKDKLVWDVGHQCYPHKVLTGRKDKLKTIRKKGGISGFPKPKESKYDAFGTGHSSTSISAIMGMAKADQLLGNSNEFVAVIGDGSLTGGMAWEALSNVKVNKTNITIVINDNDIGIDPNHGSIGDYLNHLINTSSKKNLFTDWDFDYFQVKDGHDLNELNLCFERVFKSKKPRIVHVKTIKGKGFQAAEEEQTKWHSVKYVKVKGLDNKLKSHKKGEKFQDVFGNKLLQLARTNEKIVAITPAMPSGSSINIMMKEIPDRVFDVGIAEQHAVTFSAGLAIQGLKPFCNIYSSFFQRAYDQYIHDVCLQNLNVTFFLDRAGIVGADGPTHHGLYDLAFLRCIPNTVVAAPFDGLELEKMMDFANEYAEGPLIIRYPRGRSSNLLSEDSNIIKLGKGRQLREGKDVAILSIGSIGDQAILAAEKLESEGVQIGIYDMRFLVPLDIVLIKEVSANYKHIICLENASKVGGFGSAVLELANELNLAGKFHLLGFPNQIIEHAEPKELFEKYELDAKGIVKYINGLTI